MEAGREKKEGRGGGREREIGGGDRKGDRNDSPRVVSFVLVCLRKGFGLGMSGGIRRHTS